MNQTGNIFLSKCRTQSQPQLKWEMDKFSDNVGIVYIANSGQIAIVVDTKIVDGNKLLMHSKFTCRLNNAYVYGPVKLIIPITKLLIWQSKTQMLSGVFYSMIA